MKKLITLLIATAMLASLSACGSEGKESSKEEIITETSPIATIETTTEKNLLNSEFSVGDITFNVSNDWHFEEGSSPISYLWYPDGFNYILVSYDDMPSLASFNKDNQEEFLNGFMKSIEGSEIIETENVTLLGMNDVLKAKIKSNNTIITFYAFLLNNKLYTIGCTVTVGGSEENLDNFNKVIDSIKIYKQSTTNPIELATEKIAEETTEKQSDTSMETPTEKEKVQAHQNGMFKVGTDIEAGEYMLFATSTSGYLCVSSDANQDDIIFNENFGNNLIATFEDGEYIELSRCMAVPFDPIPDDITDLIKNYIDEGAMYKVGKNIEAGEYKLECTSDISGYYCIYSDSRHDDIISNDNFDNNTYVNVSDGEYLLLSRCKIVE